MSRMVQSGPLERSVMIEISNKTHDITLHNPRSYCSSGNSVMPPSPRIAPGVTGSCEFTNSSNLFRGCVGVLVYEADTFTLAILFSNPFNYTIFDMELAMEISFRKAHLSNLEFTYRRMYSGNPDDTGKTTSFHRVKLGACQEPVVVSDGGVVITATMSNAKQSIIKVDVENRESPTP